MQRCFQSKYFSQIAPRVCTLALFINNACEELITKIITILNNNNISNKNNNNNNNKNNNNINKIILITTTTTTLIIITTTIIISTTIILITIIASVSEFCNCATRSHFALYICTYVSHAWALGHTKRRHTQAPRACRVVTWFARMSHGYMVCVRARVAWLHGLRPCACRVVTWFA